MLIDAADEPDAAARADRRRRADRGRHDPPALGPPPRARRRSSQATGAAVVAGEPDADAITEQTGVAVDQRVGEGDRIAVGTCSLARHPGRRPHARLDLPGVRRRLRPAPHLFTGDSLFPGGVGNTQGDADRFAPADRRRRRPSIFDTLPDETWFYPGHGNDSTLGVERPHLEEWRERGW